jgi:hypothetical protein
MVTLTNSETGIEYDQDSGNSVKKYVPVLNGEVVNQNPLPWPLLFGIPHDRVEQYYEYIPFFPTPFDPNTHVVDNALSGWNLVKLNPEAPDGHPKGIYSRTEIIKRRSIAELKILIDGYFKRAQEELWPQEPGFDQAVASAKELIASGNLRQDLRDIVARNDSLVTATFANNARKKQLYSEIEAAGETGAIDFNPEEGWITAI